MGRIILIPFLIIWFSGSAQVCQDPNRFTEAQFFNRNTIISELDQIYGSAVNHQGQNQNLTMDIFYPDTTIDAMAHRPLVMLIHGGGFSAGSKEVLREECRLLAERGFVTASINYRLGWNSSPPNGQIRAIYRAHQDAKAAMRYLVSNWQDYGIDTNWVFIGGGSAGAITSNLVTYQSELEWTLIYPGIVNLLGGLDNSTNAIVQDFDIKGVWNNWGAVFPSVMQNSELVPQIAFHGVLDPTVAIDTGSNGLIGSHIIHQELISNTICAELNVDSTGGHGIYIDPNGRLYRSQRTACFFRSVMCGGCQSQILSQVSSIQCSSGLDLEDPGIQKSFSLYPNPSDATLYIISPEEKFNLRLFQANGREMEAILNGNRLEVSHLPKGLYFIRLSSLNSSSQTLRFLKK